MALGGTPRAIFDLVLGEGVGLLVAGFLVGAAGAFGIRRSIEAQLFGVRPTDPGVLAIVTLVLASVALVACIIPARRATRVDPVLALNRE